MRRKFLTLSHKDAETQRLSMQSYIHFVTLQEKCNYFAKGNGYCDFSTVPITGTWSYRQEASVHLIPLQNSLHKQDSILVVHQNSNNPQIFLT